MVLALSGAITGEAVSDDSGRVLLAQTKPTVSLTGTYEGGYACDQTNNGVADGIFTTAELGVVQHKSGEIDVALSFVIPTAGPQTLLFRGRATSDPRTGAISGYFQKCGGTFESIELARIPLAQADEGNFAFTADSIFQSTAVPTLEGQLVVASCKYVFNRTDRTAPQIKTCE